MLEDILIVAVLIVIVLFIWRPVVDILITIVMVPLLIIGAIIAGIVKLFK